MQGYTVVMNFEELERAAAGRFGYSFLRLKA